MSWNKHRGIAIAFCAAFFAISSAATSRAGCCDWLFGKGQTTYSMPYTAPTVYVSNYSVVPAQPACGCATVANYASACSTCAPTTAYRIAYRPVPTVTYMPVTSVDSSSGCAVTMYQPARTWTYYGSLVPYTAGYAAPAYPGCGSCSSCGGCSSCGCAPPSGYSSCYGGCSTCGVPAGGCSSCSAGVTASYAAAPSGCSSCGVGGTVLPGPAEMSQPPVSPSTTIIPSAPVTLGTPALAPTAPIEAPAKTYAPNSGEAPVAPGAPAAANGSSTDNRSFRLPAATEAGRTIDPPHVQGVPPVVEGPKLMAPTPAPLPEGSDRVTSLPVIRASYFQLLAPPPATVPAQTVSAPSASSNLPADDAGWVHVER